jgi:hypothetical protein
MQKKIRNVSKDQIKMYHMNVLCCDTVHYYAHNSHTYLYNTS